MSAEARLAAKLAELGLELPPAPEPKGVYKPLVVLGNLVYTSGHLPVDAAGKLVTGRVGADLDVAGRLRGGRNWPAWASWPRCARSSAGSTASAAWSRCWAWSTARRSSPSSRP